MGRGNRDETLPRDARAAAAAVNPSGERASKPTDALAPDAAPAASLEPPDDERSDDDVDAAAEGERDAGDDGAVGDDAALLAPDDAPDAPVGPMPRSEERELDRALVKRAQDGDAQAFRQLFDRYHRRAFAVAYGVLKNRQDAMDVVQEGFVKVHRHLASFQGTSSFYTWLYRIVMNLAIDQLRRKKTQKPVEYDDALAQDDVASEEIMPRMLDANPRKTVIRRELLIRVQAALETLPEYHRQVIVLREIEGLSYEEMAEVLEVPKGTIMSRLFHARRKMQAALQDYVDGDMDIEE